MPDTKKGITRLTQGMLHKLCAGRTEEQIGKELKRLMHPGAPPKPIDYDLVLRLRKAGCTEREIAAECGVTVEALIQRMKRDPLLRELYEYGEERGKAALRVAQFHKASVEKDTGMLIWQGKNRLGQRDKAEITGANGGPLNVVITPAEEKY